MIDMDIVAYRCAAVNENADEGIARWQVDELVRRILSETGATGHTGYLTGENNFRRVLYPEYKANRKDQPKPKWLEQCREQLVTEWGATITDGYEADDALGMYQCDVAEYETGTTVICSIDKDLLMIPGQHYNFVKQIWSEVSESEGLLNFYTSVLVGDSVDNIKGCPGIGKAKAPKILQECQTEWELYQACLNQYKNIFKDEGETQLILNAQLLWIWRRMDEIYQPPVEPEVT